MSGLQLGARSVAALVALGAAGALVAASVVLEAPRPSSVLDPTFQAHGGQVAVTCPPTDASWGEAHALPDGSVVTPQVTTAVLSAGSEPISSAEAQTLSHEVSGQAQPVIKMVGVEGGSDQALLADLCAPQASTGWYLVPGGSGAKTLQLVNPSARTSVVMLQAWRDGAELLEGQSFTVPGKSVQTVELNSVVDGDEAYLLSVSGDGPGIASAVVLRTRKGLKPAGADWLPQLRSAKQSVFPGVFLTSGGARLMLSNPGKSAAKVSVTMRAGERSEALAGVQNVVIEPSATLDLDLSGLSLGERSISVESSEPIVAQVLMRTGSGPAPQVQPGAPAQEATPSTPDGQVALTPEPQSVGAQATQPYEQAAEDSDFAALAPAGAVSAARIPAIPGAQVVVGLVATDPARVTVNGQIVNLGSGEASALGASGPLEISSTAPVRIALRMATGQGIASVSLASGLAQTGTVPIRLR